MAKSMVERYEQILAQDAGSMVFVELAKALVDRGEYDRAIETCKQGIEHHPDSIVGRVLWGKALIHSGKPADAMDQFDKAVAIERDNPHAYNLIGEVLLHRGLYRSAIPILKKAVALQPNEPRVRQWLEQAQKSLAGGAAPAPLPTQVDPPRDATEPSAAAVPDPFQAPLPSDAARAAASQLDVTLAQMPAVHMPAAGDEVVAGLTDVFNSLAGPDSSLRSSPGLPATPAAATPSAAMSWEAPPAPIPETPFPPLTGPDGSIDPSTLPTDTDIPLPDAPSPPAPSPQGSPEVGTLGAPSSGGGVFSGLLGDIPPPDAASSPAPGTAPAGPPTPKPGHSPPPGAPPPMPRRSGVLASVPDLMLSDQIPLVPKVDVTPETAAAIAREYERELRAKLLAAPLETFWRRHWLKFAALGVAVIVAAAGTAVFFYWKKQNAGSVADAALRRAHLALLLDTEKGYRAAIVEAEDALDAVAADARALAVAAFAHAALAGEIGAGEDHAKKAQQTIGLLDPATQKAAVLAARAALAAEGGRDTATGPIEDSLPSLPDKGWASAEVLRLSARGLIARGKPTEGIERLRQALEAEGRHVRTLVEAGGAYLAAREPQLAADSFQEARKISADHPGAILGLAESRLGLGRELPEAWDEVQKLAAGAQKQRLAPAQRARLDLVTGKLLAAKGEVAAAVEKLTAGAALHREQAADFHAAAGEAQAAAGQFDKAAEAYSRAADARREDADLKETLARALVAAGRYGEALRRTENPGDHRMVRLVRGIARYEQREYRRARSELEATKRDGKMPAEAAVYLALVDLADGQPKRATAVIEAAAQRAGARPLARVARGRLVLADGRIGDALKEFEQAAADLSDYEGACSFGRLLLSEGRLAEALKALEKAVARNRVHAEALGALGEIQLIQGDVAAARATFESILASAREKPLVAVGERGMAKVLVAEGNVAEARRRADRAGQLDGSYETVQARAHVAFAAGDSSGAYKLLEKAAKLVKDEAEPWCLVGSAYRAAGDLASAQRAADTALKIDPYCVCAKVNQALADGSKNPRSGLRALDGIPLADASVREKARTAGAKAYLQAMAGDFARARREADKALGLYAGEPLAHLALALASRSEAGTAQKGLARALALDTSEVTARYQLAELYARDDATTGKAAAEYELYAKLAPRSAAASAAKKAAQSLRQKGPRK